MCVCVCLFGGKETQGASGCAGEGGAVSGGGVRAPGLYVRAFGCGSTLFGVPLSASNGRYLFVFAQSHNI